MVFTPNSFRFRVCLSEEKKTLSSYTQEMSNTLGDHQKNTPHDCKYGRLIDGLVTICGIILFVLLSVKISLHIFIDAGVVPDTIFSSNHLETYCAFFIATLFPAMCVQWTGAIFCRYYITYLAPNDIFAPIKLKLFALILLIVIALVTDGWSHNRGTVDLCLSDSIETLFPS